MPLLGIESKKKKKVTQAFLKAWFTKYMMLFMEKFLDIHKGLKNLEDNEKFYDKNSCLTCFNVAFHKIV